MSNVQLAQEMYDAFARGDIGTVLGRMDPQVEWREAEGNPLQPSGEAWIGPDAIVQNLFMKLGTEWDGFAVNVKQLHDAGNSVVAEGRYSGAFKDTGQTLDAQFCHVLTFRDGKLTSFQQYVDTAQMQAVMGSAG